jgi:hypothetical protein
MVSPVSFLVHAAAVLLTAFLVCRFLLDRIGLPAALVLVIVASETLSFVALRLLRAWRTDRGGE